MRDHKTRALDRQAIGRVMNLDITPAQKRFGPNREEILRVENKRLKTDEPNFRNLETEVIGYFLTLKKGNSK